MDRVPRKCCVHRAVGKPRPLLGGHEERRRHKDRNQLQDESKCSSREGGGPG